MSQKPKSTVAQCQLTPGGKPRFLWWIGEVRWRGGHSGRGWYLGIDKAVIFAKMEEFADLERCFLPGKAYYLGGKTGLPLGGTKSTEFTVSCLQDGASCGVFIHPFRQTPPCLHACEAVIYIKLLGSDNSEEETVMLKEGRVHMSTSSMGNCNAAQLAGCPGCSFRPKL